MTTQRAMIEALEAISGWSDLTAAEWERRFPKWNERWAALRKDHGDVGLEDAEIYATRDLFIEIAREGLGGDE